MVLREERTRSLEITLPILWEMDCRDGQKWKEGSHLESCLLLNRQKKKKKIIVTWERC